MNNTKYCHICMEDYSLISSNYEKYLFKIPFFDTFIIKFISNSMYKLECGHSTCLKCIILTIYNCETKCPFCRDFISSYDFINIVKLFHSSYKIYTYPIFLIGINNTKFKRKKFTRNKTEKIRIKLIYNMLSFYLMIIDNYINYNYEYSRYKGEILNLMIDIIRENKWFLKKNHDFQKVFLGKMNEISNLNKRDSNSDFKMVLSEFWKNEFN